MKLDSRILEGKKPLTCFDIEEAKKYVGKDCYFSSKFEDFENLSKVPHATLHNVDDSHTPFQSYGKDGVLCYDCFILPCEWVKEEEKTYRPYKDVKELFEDIGVYIGDVVNFRRKDSKAEYHALITSYIIDTEDGTTKICLGSTIYYTTQELFNLFELRSHGEWIPFGIKGEVKNDS